MYSVYLETSVVSYYTARPSRDIRVAAHQQATDIFWDKLGSVYKPYVSALVLQEAGCGDEDQVRKRFEVLQGFPVLDIDERAEQLAEQFTKANAVPEEFPEDGLHIALAAVNSIEILATWNCKHINNPFTRLAVRGIVESEGYVCPEIQSPEELLGEES